MYTDADKSTRLTLSTLVVLELTSYLARLRAGRHRDGDDSVFVYLFIMPICSKLIKDTLPQTHHQQQLRCHRQHTVGIDDILHRIGQNDPGITTLEIRFSANTRESSCVDNQEKKCKLIATELIDDDNDDWDISDKEVATGTICGQQYSFEILHRGQREVRHYLFRHIRISAWKVRDDYRVSSSISYLLEWKTTHPSKR